MVGRLGSGRQTRLEKVLLGRQGCSDMGRYLLGSNKIANDILSNNFLDMNTSDLILGHSSFAMRMCPLLALKGVVIPEFLELFVISTRKYQDIGHKNTHLSGETRSLPNEGKRYR